MEKKTFFMTEGNKKHFSGDSDIISPRFLSPFQPVNCDVLDLAYEPLQAVGCETQKQSPTSTG